MTDIRAAALHFEAVKVALRQSKNGVMLTLSIHPNDMRGELWQHHIGSRYMVALVKLADDDTPEPPPAKAGQQAVAEAAGATIATGREAAPKQTSKPPQRWNEMKLAARAAILCDDGGYHKFLWHKTGQPCASEETATQLTRKLCDVGSRREFDIAGSMAQRAYLALEAEFNRWSGRAVEAR